MPEENRSAVCAVFERGQELFRLLVGGVVIAAVEVFRATGNRRAARRWSRDRSPE
jgi:hypothetical protein